jgi:FKBP-type peptidyl-prolyl cis-trans isomerase FkpA
MKFKICIAFLIPALSFVSTYGQDFQEKDGLKYKMLVQHNGQKPAVGETAMVDMIFFGEKDQPIFNSAEKNQAVPIPITKSQFKGDLMQGLQMLGVGDSAIFLICGDSIAKLSPGSSNIKPGSWLKYVIKLRSIYNPAVQKKTEDETIRSYLHKNKIRGAKHTASGLYYKITGAGKGAKPKEGQSITVHYTGRFLDGKEFDSDKGEGFTFVLGKYEVIPGWEEAFALLKKGSKATIYLPSSLGYGVGGGGPIPPNTILVFEVELADIK